MWNCVTQYSTVANKTGRKGLESLTSVQKQILKYGEEKKKGLEVAGKTPHFSMKQKGWYLTTDALEKEL